MTNNVRKVGYARVSTEDQQLGLQLDALRFYGCEKIYQEKASGKSAINRVSLKACLESLNEGDILVVWKLDRLGRSMSDLTNIIQSLKEKNVGFVSLTEKIDLQSAGGVLIFHLFGAFAQFERDLIRERINAGVKAAKNRGVHLGRNHKVNDAVILNMYNQIEAGTTVTSVCDKYGITRATYYKRLKLLRDKDKI